MRVFLEFGEERVDLGNCGIPQLASIDPTMITQQLVTQGIPHQLSGLAFFEDGGRPSWEAYPNGGDLSWRGDLTNAGLNRVWRSLCCTLVHNGRPFVGARILNKSRGSSNMIKIEVWYEGDPSQVRPLIIDEVVTFLPAASSQFVGVSHKAKMERTNVARSAKSRPRVAKTVSRGHTASVGHTRSHDPRKRGRKVAAVGALPRE